jgi:hypothetical protein
MVRVNALVNSAWFSRLVVAFVPATAVAITLLSPPACYAANMPPTQSASIPERQVSPKVLALAKEWFHRFQTGNIDRSQLDATSNLELTAESIRQQEAALSALGKPVAFKFLGSAMIQDDKAYHFLITFTGPDRIVESIALDNSGKIAGIDFATYTPGTT